jgi:putative endonuclease
VIVRNHGTPVGEVDLVCRDGETTCFVEVRSRAEVEHGAPAETVSRAKALRVVRAARDWLAKNGGEERPIRFDVVAVTLADGAPAFEHFPAAFDADGDTRLW